MTNNELLAKMLDGTLTASERTILNAEAAAHPEFANELEQMKRIESILTKSGNRYDIPTPAFLQSVEDEIAQKVRDSRSVKPIPILPPNIFDIKFNWNLLIMACSGLVTIASLGYYGYNKLYPPAPIVISEQQTAQQPESTTNPLAQSPQISRSNEKSISVARKQSLTIHSTENTAIEQSKAIVEKSPNQLLAAKETNKDSIDASIASNSNANTLTQKIQKTLSELNEKRAAGDKINEMSLRKQVGLLYSQAGSNSEAHKYLSEALEIAKSNNFRQAEGNILGEIGLIEKQMGNMDSAINKLHQAIDILNSSGSPSAKWTKALSNIQNK
ncbi:MAG: tetratricopeptide repeat protein [Ignavibacteriae bacterium]|nr:tetratricopeptide repeat protein [Ignavibacteriota bacterium]